MASLLRDVRVVIFVSLLAAALVVIYMPSPLGPGILGGPSGNLKFGLDLVGGSRLQVELKGVIVKVDAPGMNESQIRNFLQNRTGAEVIPVRYKGEIMYEIRKDITKEQLEEILKEKNASIGLDRQGKPLFFKGLTRETVEETRKIMETKLNMLGLKSVVTRTVADNIIMIDLAGVPIDEARRIIGTPGKFEIRMQTAGDKGDISEGQMLSEIKNMTVHVLYGEDIVYVDPMPHRGENGKWGASFKLSDDGADKLQNAAIKYGAVENPDNHELVMLLDDIVIYSAPLKPTAASSLSSKPIKIWIAETGFGEEGRKKAEELIIHLRAGVLPVPVEILASGEVTPPLGEKFREGSVIALILALIVVGVMIMIRYKNVRVVMPLVITLLSEVIMMLGFAAAIGWQLDLPSIAGIITVIGTGVDQLVMITDEAMAGGKTSGRVYYRRVSFAYSIIFASVVTTIVAMLTLASMALGVLRGFAIVTIVGLLIGILVTRPAYAKILEYLL